MSLFPSHTINTVKALKCKPSAQGISYTHAIHVYACAVLLLVGWSINFFTTFIHFYTSFALFHAITFERSIFTKKKSYFKNKASVALNPLVSPIGCFVVRSGRKRGNRQTDR